ncbi:Pls/PosA family non-ribosomal peptide synthetase [Pseudonocardia halophobica]|uniref:Pls/PosA family non-ribosomal peptide synthetase n=1 Tax=Pseudonocardia halophobica TaxID=29401 RepID=UPI003D91D039
MALLPPTPGSAPAEAPAGPPAPLSELVLVDRHEAQGWRVRRHERLDSVFEERCDWIREYGRAGQLAVDGPGASLTYDELDARANRLARYLRLHGARPGDRVALLFDVRVETYVALLAVLKIGATCVPLDPDAPTERLGFLVADAEVRLVLTRSHLRGRVAVVGSLPAGAEILTVDDAAALIAEMSPQRLQPAERGEPVDRPAYVVHVPGPAGWSERVEIDHRSMCNAVRVSSETFGVRGHRLYQGRALFSGGGIEEVWMAWAAGATLVPAPDGPRLVGDVLHAVLAERRVTALCTTPAVLATLEADLPQLRFLLVSGEACPQSLVARWHRPARRFLVAYVPPGATVAATWTDAHPDKPMTIGVPLPTFATVVLDPEVPARALRHGETGEIGVAGLGLACGFPDPASDAFVDDFLGIPGNPSGRIYRTGDLGRVDDAGEIEYRGRRTLQVLVHGERVDLTAIESVMLAVPGVASAAVAPHEPEPGVTELVGFYTLRADSPAVTEREIGSWLRERLATDHVPARLERLDSLPLTADGRVDREALPLSGGEMTRLRAENARLHEQLEQLRPPVTPVDAAPPVPPVPSAPAVLPAPVAPPAPPAPAASGNLTLDQIIGATPPAPVPAATPAPAPRPESQPGILTFDQIIGSTAPAPAPEKPATRRPTPYPRASAPAPVRPTPFPRQTGPAPSPAPNRAPSPAPRPAASAPTQAPRPPAPSPFPRSTRPTPFPRTSAPMTPTPFPRTSAPARPAPAPRPVVPPTPAPLPVAPAAPAPTPAALAPAPAAPAPAPAKAPSSAGLASSLASVLAEVLAVEHVPTDRNVFDDLGADSMVMTRFCARLRKRADLPSISIKDVYAHPTIAGLATAFAPSMPVAAPVVPVGAAGDDVVHGLAQVLAEVLGVDRVPTDRNVFDDLGADSMVMTRFCARLRKREDLPSISIRDVYANPTIAGMAAAAAPSTAAPAPVQAAPAPVVPVRHSTFGYYVTGFLQLLVFALYATAAGVVMDRAYRWISTSTTVLETYIRSVEAGAGAFLALCLLPVVAKWVLVGRWKEKEFPVWSLRYFRFWLVKTLVRGNPIALLMVGSPIYTLYLRALGAKVGRDVVILTRNLPVCTDLVTIGSGTVIRKDALMPGYRAHAGKIQTGRVTLGQDVVVGDKSVLDIGTAMGDGAQLGHASSLHRGQSVPAGQSWHGSPAVPTDTDFRAVPPLRIRALRKVSYVTSQLVKLFAIYLPLGFGGLYIVVNAVPRFKELLQPGVLGYTTSAFYLEALAESAIIVFGGLAVGLLIVLTVPRLVALFVRPDRVYPMHGWRYSLHRTVTRLTNVKTFVYLFGDSSFIVGYLYLLGYDLGKVEQTGSNFGSAIAQETPFLTSVGRGTVVADGLSVNNADFSNTSFRTARVAIGRNSFLGNAIAYPIGGRIGDDCLLATKVAVPVDGPVRQGVGLLGSPAFEIPRTVQRDRVLEIDMRERRRRLRRKNLHNLVTIGLALLVRWGHVLGLLLLGLLALDHFQDFGAVAFGLEVVASLLFTIVWFVLWERLIVGFRRLRPKSCSIYDKAFWRHERFWKLVVPPMEKLLGGTPYKNLVARMLGVRVGRRVFDDGIGLTERTLTAIGDDCTLNFGTTIQCHSQEDGAFKSDRTTLGAGVTLGLGAFVHYGVTVGDAAEIAPDSFVMKGEEIPAGARWGGNPAHELADPPAPAPPALPSPTDRGASDWTAALLTAR